LKLLQLKYLIAITDNGLNITAAANKLYTSQPGISKQLRMLEKELGVRLFLRRGRSLTAVTPAGKQIIDRARLIMREVDNMLALARGFIDDGQADLDEAVNNKPPMVAARGLSTHRPTRTLRRRPF
jgi:LysR family transcriptional regulator, cys regulon transcriptional activator